MSIFEKFLNKSNSYVYYKQGYEKTQRDLKNKNNKLKNNQKKISSLEKKLEKNSSKINKLKKEISNKDNLILNQKNKINEYDLIISLFGNKFNKYNLISSIDNLKDITIAYVLLGFPVHSETFIVSEVKWLLDNGYNVIIFSRFDPYKPVDIDFDVVNIRFETELELMALLVKYDVDLMHTHFVFPVCTEFTYPVAEKLKIPFTVFAHAFDIFINENDKINNVSEISKSKYCKAIFTLSEFHKNYLIERDVDEDKIVITKQASNYEISHIIKKDNKIKKIVSVSRFVEKKGIDVLINAAKLLENEDFEFSVYGFGELENSLKNQITELNCKNITIKGELRPDEVKNVLMDSDLLVSPCKVAKNGDMDGFPTVIFEAMAVGLPILTTSVSAIPEIIEDGVNGFLTDPDNPELLAKKIMSISKISNEELLDIKKTAQEDVKNISSVEKTMEKYIDTIKH